MNRLNNYINLISMYGGDNKTKCEYIKDAKKHNGFPNAATWVANNKIDDTEKLWGRKFKGDLVAAAASGKDIDQWLDDQLKAENCGVPAPPAPVESLKCKYIKDAKKHDGFPNAATWVANNKIDDTEKLWGRKFKGDLVAAAASGKDIDQWLDDQLKAEGCGVPAPPAPIPKKCGPNEELDAAGNCVCIPGYERNASGQCVPIPKKCGPNEVLDASGNCVCIPGYVRDPTTGQCVKQPPPPKKCGPNEVLDASGNCVCIPGYVRDPTTGQCVKQPPPPKICGPNEMLDASGNCVCMPGYVRDPITGQCVIPPQQPPQPPQQVPTKAPHLTIQSEYYDASDQQYHNFRVTVYVTKNNKDIFIGGGNASRNDRVKDVLTLFKQKCNTCIVSSGRQYVKSLEGADLYTQFSNLVLKYDNVDLYIIN